MKIVKPWAKKSLVGLRTRFFTIWIDWKFYNHDSQIFFHDKSKYYHVVGFCLNRKAIYLDLK